MIFERFRRRGNQEADQIHLQKFRLFSKRMQTAMDLIQVERTRKSESADVFLGTPTCKSSADFNLFRLFPRNTAYFPESVDVIFRNTVYFSVYLSEIIFIFQNQWMLFPPK